MSRSVASCLFVVVFSLCGCFSPRVYLSFCGEQCADPDCCSTLYLGSEDREVINPCVAVQSRGKSLYVTICNCGQIQSNKLVSCNCPSDAQVISKTNAPGEILTSQGNLDRQPVDLESGSTGVTVCAENRGDQIDRYRHVDGGVYMRLEGRQ